MEHGWTRAFHIGPTRLAAPNTAIFIGSGYSSGLGECPEDQLEVRSLDEPSQPHWGIGIDFHLVANAPSLIFVVVKAEFQRGIGNGQTVGVNPVIGPGDVLKVIFESSEFYCISAGERLLAAVSIRSNALFIW